MCRAAGFEPDVRFTSADILLNRHLVETGHAAALLPSLPGPPDLRSTRILELPTAPKRQIFTAIRNGAKTHPAVVALLKSLEHAAKLHGEKMVRRA
jgi:DNA-binding transcriptional LysR family regulator